MKRKYTWRTFFNDIHLWLGVGSGLILFIVCLSGTILTFWPDMDRWQHPEKYKVAVTESAPLSIAVLKSKVSEQIEGEIVSVQISDRPDESYTFSVKEDPKQRRGTAYFVQPYTGEVLGDGKAIYGGGYRTWFRMHRWLLLDTEIGRPIVGISTIIFLFLMITGFILWLPKRMKYMKQGLVIKSKSGWKRLNHDLHNVLGFYALILLLVMGLTGLNWSFEWYKNGLSQVLNAQVFGGRGEKSEPLSIIDSTAEVMSADEFYEKSKALLAGGGITSLPLQYDATKPVAIRKVANGFFSVRGADNLQLHPITGEPLAVELFSEKTLGQQIAQSIKPLHTGEIMGTFSKILYFITCLIGTTLPITGIIIWINKLKKKRSRKKKAVAKSQAVEANVAAV
ncbi:PepSY-associated TM helix domain-containing protein [Membranihabitans marinus]|uniref:PepSY-associated TM helix domain-containing protein n=1 Tax=Membranihabitans marinus TaxID=1227546 RepID=UPI001F3F8928|nr:PepSY-associated TM helix domain-containing protein [Membranihabitans marinus]